MRKSCRGTSHSGRARCSDPCLSRRLRTKAAMGIRSSAQPAREVRLVVGDSGIVRMSADTWPATCGSDGKACMTWWSIGCAISSSRACCSRGSASTNACCASSSDLPHAAARELQGSGGRGADRDPAEPRCDRGPAHHRGAAGGGRRPEWPRGGGRAAGGGQHRRRRHREARDPAPDHARASPATGPARLFSVDQEIHLLLVESTG